MEFLKDVLDDRYEEFKSIIDKYNAENEDKAVKLANLASGEYVSKGKYNNAVADKDNAMTQLNTANETIKTLEAKSINNEDLQKEIEGYKNTIATLETESANVKKTYVLREQLSKAGVVDPDYVIYKQGGLDNFKFDKDCKATGLDKILDGFRNDKAMSHIFVDTPSYEPTGGSANKGVNPFSEENYNLTEQGRMLRENPTMAREMAMAVGIEI